MIQGGMGWDGVGWSLVEYVGFGRGGKWRDEVKLGVVSLGSNGTDGSTISLRIFIFSQRVLLSLALSHLSPSHHSSAVGEVCPSVAIALSPRLPASASVRLPVRI